MKNKSGTMRYRKDGDVTMDLLMLRIFSDGLKKILLKIFQRINMSSMCPLNLWDMHHNGGQTNKQHEFETWKG